MILPARGKSPSLPCIRQHLAGSLHMLMVHCTVKSWIVWCWNQHFFTVWNLCIVLVLVIIIYDYHIMLLHTAVYLSHDWLYIDSHPLSWHPKAMNACSKAHRWSLALWLFGESLSSTGGRPPGSPGLLGARKTWGSWCNNGWFFWGMCGDF